jgi:hypothetical protein
MSDDHPPCKYCGCVWTDCHDDPTMPEYCEVADWDGKPRSRYKRAKARLSKEKPKG